ncbi:hypothetical protein JCM3765_006859 [Sporobolomyces pararoseus]
MASQKLDSIRRLNSAQESFKRWIRTKRREIKDRTAGADDFNSSSNSPSYSTTAASPSSSPDILDDSFTSTSRARSPVMLAGGSIQSMVTEGSLTPGPNKALIAGAIGGTVGVLVVVLAIFFTFYRIRRCAAPRDVNNEKEEQDKDSVRHSRIRNATPSSSRPVSVFSDTTIDSNETRKKSKNKLRRKDSITRSLRSLRGIKQSEEDDRDGGSSPVVARLEDLSHTFSTSSSSPASPAMLSSPSSMTISYSNTSSTSQSGGSSRGGVLPLHFQAQSQLSFPPASQFATRSIGGYAAALQRAGGSLSSPQSSVGPTGSRGGSVAEPYEEKYY